MNDLITGSLSKILNYVHNDSTLDLELRGRSVILYYRGSKLLEIKEKGIHDYDFIVLDKNYYTKFNEPIVILTELKDSYDIVEYIPTAKRCIDYYLQHVKANWEHEIQQCIVRENNYTDNAPDTDFYCIDMEYVEPEEAFGRADVVALQWDATTTSHKSINPKANLYIIEVKQGEQAIKTITGGNPGIKKHYKDFVSFRESPKAQAFIAEMLAVFKQKYQLGLIHVSNPQAIIDKKGNFKIFNVEKLEMACVLANYKHRSSILKDELNQMTPKALEELKIFKSCYMGYGLYSSYLFKASEILYEMTRCR